VIPVCPEGIPDAWETLLLLREDRPCTDRRISAMHGTALTLPYDDRVIFYGDDRTVQISTRPTFPVQ
jgi:hypothetical protein